MNKTLFIIGLIITFFFLPEIAFGQRYMIQIPISQQDSRIHVTLMLQEKNSALGAMTQDFRIIIKNNTNDKLKVHIEYGADLVCGIRKTYKVGVFDDGLTLNASESVGKPYDTDGSSTAVRLLGNSCPKETWKKLDKNEAGSELYSMINSLFYRVIKIENLTENEKAEAEKKELEQRKRQEEKDLKLAEEKKQKEELEQKQVAENTSTNNQSDNDFWSDNGNRTSNNTTSSSTNNATETDEKFVSSTNFQNNLSHIKEGEYFKDDKGGYYKRTSKGAEKVDEYIYEKESARKITAKFEQDRIEREVMAEKTTNAIQATFTSFYSMRNAGQNLKDASRLDGHFNNIEELNSTFSRKLNEVSRMGNELRSTSVQNTQNLAQSLAVANSTSSADYTAYGQALGSFAGVISAMNADREADEARAELRAQRDAQERAIKARQLQALVNIRTEIGKTFTEGGMPLSSHKIDAPVLYLFAYASNKAEWNEDKTVAMIVSNVIPVYRYSDGTYPFISNVTRTFENGGVKNPTVIGYFTDKAMADKYHQSLVEMSEQGRFAVKQVDIKVKEKDINTNTNKDSDTDFWENPIETTKKQKTTPKSQKDDFWNN